MVELMQEICVSGIIMQPSHTEMKSRIEELLQHHGPRANSASPAVTLID
jgi:hypothetical protein